MTTQPIPFEVVESPSTRNPDILATLPLVASASELLLDCAAAGGIGIISGKPGSGKSVALRRLAARYPSMGLPGHAVYYCCQNNAGPTRGVKDLLSCLGIGGSLLANGNGTSLQILLKLALRDLSRKNIRVLLLDEIDRWDAEAIGGMLALCDHLRDNGHSLTLIAASISESPAWLSNNEAFRSRTLRILRTEPISISEMVSLLALWSDDFANFAKNPDEEIAHRIYEHAGNDLRRLNFFAKLHQRHFVGHGVSEETVKKSLGLLDEE